MYTVVSALHRNVFIGDIFRFIADMRPVARIANKVSLKMQILGIVIGNTVRTSVKLFPYRIVRVVSVNNCPFFRNDINVVRGKEATPSLLGSGVTTKIFARGYFSINFVYNTYKAP